jgi:prevent-host-death family protein
MYLVSLTRCAGEGTNGVPMKSVSAHKASRCFLRLLEEAENGESVVITRRGTPVAVLSPYCRRPQEDERERAIERVMRLMQNGLSLGGARLTRDEMHER